MWKNYHSILPEHQPLVGPAVPQLERRVEHERHRSRLSAAYGIITVLVLGALLSISSSRRVRYSLYVPNTRAGLNQQTIEEESLLVEKSILQRQIFDSVDAEFAQLEDWKRRIVDVWGPFWNDTSKRWKQYKQTISDDSKTLQIETKSWWHNFEQETVEWWNENKEKASDFFDAEGNKTADSLKHVETLVSAEWNETVKETGEWVTDAKEITSDWLNGTEQALAEDEQRAGEWLGEKGHQASELMNNTGRYASQWLSETKNKSASWLHEAEHNSDNWIHEAEYRGNNLLNETEHVSANWLSAGEHMLTDSLNRSEKATSNWIAQEEQNSAEWWNHSRYDTGRWINDEEHKVAELWNGTAHRASTWMSREGYESAHLWNETGQIVSQWIKDEDKQVKVWLNNTEEETSAWLHQVEEEIEHTEDSWNTTWERAENWWHKELHWRENRSHFLIYMNSSDAYRILTHESNRLLDLAHDYFLIQQGFDTQLNQAYCAVASTAAIINSFRGDIELPSDPLYDPYHFATQTDLFNECTESRVVRRNSTFDGIFAAPGGLSMLQTKALLECHLKREVWNVTTHFVDPSVMSMDEFRRDIQQALTSSKTRVIINYHRQAVGQIGGGHFSPLGAFSPDMDAFLVMDVAKYKYPNAWISTALLYNSLQTVDACGKWDFPYAQEIVPPKYLYAKTEFDYLSATIILGCESTHRGYITIEKID